MMSGPLLRKLSTCAARSEISVDWPEIAGFGLVSSAWVVARPRGYFLELDVQGLGLIGDLWEWDWLGRRGSCRCCCWWSGWLSRRRSGSAGVDFSGQLNLRGGGNEGGDTCHDHQERVGECSGSAARDDERLRSTEWVG